jgi:peptidoglycan/LPS O-acetylase OafA/YrhL
MFSGVDRWNPGAKALSAFSGVAVDLFIIISGFVIAHLVLSRQEPWGAYVLRRLLRIYPAYLVVAVISAFTTGLAAAAMRLATWDAQSAGPYFDTIQSTFASQQDFLGWHVLTHVALLQGVVPDSVLPYSSAVFLGPAWSLSLEWQFYLIAPFFVAALASRRFRLPVVGLAALGIVAFHLGWMGDYRLRSFILGVSYLFIIGIVSRLHWDRLTGQRWLLMAGAALLIPASVLVRPLLALGLWCVFAYFMGARDGRARDSTPHRLWSWAFGSQLFRHLGERSYGVYIAHWPILQTAMWFVVPLGFGQMWSVVGVAGVTVPATLAASSLLYRFVERPFMRLGRRLAKTWVGQSQQLDVRDEQPLVVPHGAVRAAEVDRFLGGQIDHADEQKIGARHQFTDRDH